MLLTELLLNTKLTHTTATLKRTLPQLKALVQDVADRCQLPVMAVEYAPIMFTEHIQVQGTLDPGIVVQCFLPIPALRFGSMSDILNDDELKAVIAHEYGHKVMEGLEDINQTNAEYLCDLFAAHMGYGKESISALQTAERFLEEHPEAHAHPDHHPDSKLRVALLEKYQEFLDSRQPAPVN